jgi:hypothetical protein
VTVVATGALFLEEVRRGASLFAVAFCFAATSASMFVIQNLVIPWDSAFCFGFCFSSPKQIRVALRRVSR